MLNKGLLGEGIGSPTCLMYFLAEEVSSPVSSLVLGLRGWGRALSSMGRGVSGSKVALCLALGRGVPVLALSTEPLSRHGDGL